MDERFLMTFFFLFYRKKVECFKVVSSGLAKLILLSENGKIVTAFKS